MTIAQITTHETDALKRLLEQYKDAENLKGVIGIYTVQIQECEDIIHDMFLSRSINNAIGAQLDRLGKVVGQNREGNTDDRYRILLFVKIGQNVSEGEPERIINIFKLLTEATTVLYQNLGNGIFALTTDGTIDPADETFIFAQMEKAIAAGVRLDFMTTFDADIFVMDGDNPDAPGVGFGDKDVPTTGGVFTGLIVP